MLFKEGGSGAPPFSGWYADLFYNVADAAKNDFVVADVHTQPTDETGNIVGKVLHVSVGRVNLGVYLASCPMDYSKAMAFVGPAFSYYETISTDFKRYTDEEWKATLDQGTVPPRPDWVNLYLADKQGQAMQKGSVLEEYTTGALLTVRKQPASSSFVSDMRITLHNNTLAVTLASATHGTLGLIDARGKTAATLHRGHLKSGMHSFALSEYNIAAGTYQVRLLGEHGILQGKIVHIK
jgi:hypothetical protein